MKAMRLITGSSNLGLSQKVASYLDCEITEAAVQKFQDGEISIQIKEDLHGKEVVLIESMAGDVNDVLIETLLIADAASRAGARRICLVSPYLAYMRQDRKDRPGVPISAKVIADMLSNSPIRHIIALDLHAKQNQGFFNVLVDEIFAADVFLPFIKKEYGKYDIVFVAPDAGSIKNVRKYAELTQQPYVFVEKERLTHSKVEARNLYGDVSGKHAIIIDDLCSSGDTLIKASNLLKSKGAEQVTAFVTHGLFTGEAIEAIDRTDSLDAFYCSDSIDNELLIARSHKVKTISLAEHIAHNISDLFLEGQTSSSFA